MHDYDAARKSATPWVHLGIPHDEWTAEIRRRADERPELTPKQLEQWIIDDLWHLHVYLPTVHPTVPHTPATEESVAAARAAVERMKERVRKLRQV